MKKYLAAINALCLLLCGCNNESTSSQSSTTLYSSVLEEPSLPAQIPVQSELSEGIIPAAEQSERIEGERLSYTAENIYSDGEFYSVEISGVKLGDEKSASELDTTYVNDVLYGDFRLDLIFEGTRIGSLKINVPRGDKFMILDSAAKNLSYGCEVLSNKQKFGADEYPDIIQLDFFLPNEGEVPQYARFFAIFDSRICEIPVYENGVLTAPLGTHLEMKSAGLMIQHLVVSGGNGYEISKYEYKFDTENRRLLKQEVKFYGWE